MGARSSSVGKPRFEPRAQPAADLSHPAIAVNLDACIQCTRCLRACRDEQVNDVIGLAFRGRAREDRVRHGRPDGRVHLRGLRRVRAGLPHRRADAGARGGAAGGRQAGRVGLPVLRRRLPAHLQRQGQPHPVRRGPRRPGQPRPAVRQGPLRLRLCAPSASPDQAADPPRRRAQARRLRDGPRATCMEVFREASWEEALDPPAARWRASATRTASTRWPASARPRAATRRPTCSRSWCAPASAATTSTTARGCAMPPRWLRCSRASARAPCRNPVMDVMQAEVVILIGANPTVNHPVAATWIKNAVKDGTKLIAAATRAAATWPARASHLQFKPDTDVALLNAMMHVIVHRGPGRRRTFIAAAPTASTTLKRNVEGYSPEAMAPICGIDAETIREVARLYATSKALDDPVGHGHQPARARHRQRALPDRAGPDDRPDRPPRHRAASAARPEQRAGGTRRRPDPDDVSRLPARGQRRRRARSFERSGACGRRSTTSRASPSSRSCEAIERGEVRGMYIMGENPAMSDPDANHAREALAALDHLVVQDIFLTETAYLADVVLPATRLPREDRQLHQHRPPGADRPAGARSAGRCEAGPVDHPADRAAHRARLALRPRERKCSTRCASACTASPASPGSGCEREHAVVYPCEEEGAPGPAGGIRRGLPDADGPRALRSRGHHPGRRAARCRLSAMC